jgi:hypothetical protein
MAVEWRRAASDESISTQLKNSQAAEIPSSSGKARRVVEGDSTKIGIVEAPLRHALHIVPAATRRSQVASERVEGNGPRGGEARAAQDQRYHQ